MRLYNADVSIDLSDKELEKYDQDENKVNRRNRGPRVKQYCQLTEDSTFQTNISKAYAFVSDAVGNQLKANVCVSDDAIDVEKYIEGYVNSLNEKFLSCSISEITSDTFFDEMKRAERHGFMKDDDAISLLIGARPMYEEFKRGNSVYADRYVCEDKSFDDIFKDIEEYSLCKNFETEICRISKGKKTKKFIGHPIHYMIMSTSGDNRRVMIRDIICALAANGRLSSKRYSIINADDRSLNSLLLTNIYSVNSGATVVVKIGDGGYSRSELKSRGLDFSEICAIAAANSSRTLTIFSIDANDEGVKASLLNELSGLAVLNFDEDVYLKEAAIAILNKLATRDGLKIDEGLVQQITQSDKEYYKNDIIFLYNRWRHQYLVTEIYPEYKELVDIFVEKKKTRIKSAYDELNEMIGLDSVKEVIEGAINCSQLNQEYKKRDIKFNNPTMHMVFTGCPGTAKTTVARLVARILKEKKVLTGGRLIEVGRADLVAGYVGQTAINVKNVFNRAIGNVLFIDEAYSLVDDRQGSYGDEAINTIVQEMENHKDEMVVILAGYKDEMQHFLDRNPGLNSRIAFHVDFANYTTDELLKIAKLIASKMSLKIDKEAEPLLVNLLETARQEDTFGNGRFVRNLLDKCKIKLAQRLTIKDINFVSNEDIVTIRKEDIPTETLENGRVRKQIGFAV